MAGDLKEKSPAVVETKQGLEKANHITNGIDSSATSVGSKGESQLTALQKKARNIEAAGYAVIPKGFDYGEGQRPGASMVSRAARFFGVRLDGVILVDYDDNKGKGTLPIPLPELFTQLEGKPVSEEEALSKAVQWRSKDGDRDRSLHYLYRLPDGYDASSLKCSNNGITIPKVDFKTGNQLVYIKDDKTLVGDTLPPPSELPEAPPALLALLKPTAPVRTEHDPAVFTDKTTKYGAAALAAACEAVANAPEGHRNSTLNTQAMKMGQLVAGGEIAEHDMEDGLMSAAMASGLDSGEAEKTLASGKNKGMSEPRKAGNVVSLRDFDDESNQDLDPEILSKLPPSRLGRLLASQLGTAAACRESGIVYQYVDGVWLPVSDARLTPMLAALFDAVGCPYSAKKLNGAVETMKVGLREMGCPSAGLIGFANGVYDLKAGQFLAHSPDYFLPSHNGIVYGEPTPGETLEQNAPNFTKWLSHAAEGDAGKMDRINAALFMVLANRYDWQLFLEVTGEGGSGKSVMANLCELLVGKENVGSTSMEAMRGQFGLENVWDKRLILLPDQSQYIGDGALLKAITGGDEVGINRKNKAKFNARVRAVVIATNNEPMKMTERNGGMVRRRVIFSFNNVVADADKDPQLGEKIATELPVIIRHLLTLFADPELAKLMLQEQRDGAEALAVKMEADPVLALCAMLGFLDKPEGLFMGGGTAGEPRRYLYHLYLGYMEYQGLRTPLGVRAFAKAVNQAAKELKKEYRKRLIKGVTQTNVVITEAAEAFMPSEFEPMV